VERDRLHAIDHLKAAAIVAVVLTHAVRGGWGLEGWSWDAVVGQVWTRFHVPSFLFVSGYLYARSAPVSWAHVGSRLGRVVLPYLVASCAVQLVGVARPPPQDAGDVLFQLATASSLGIYYFIFILCLCIPLIWPLSRLPVAAIWGLWLACLALLAAELMTPGRLHPGGSLFWDLRNPLARFQLGYFVSGWLLARTAPQWLGPRGLRRGPLAAAAGGLAALGLGLKTGLLPVTLGSFGWMLYTFGVIGLVTVFTRARPAGPLVRFLGDATLGIYLYHRIFQLLAKPWTEAWTDPLRIGAQVGVGLGGAALVVWAARRLLGPDRARRTFGA
jgi:fucose 4-O-acetylase-like acetyltransferase